MKHIFPLFALLAATALGQAPKPAIPAAPQQPPPSLASTVDREITTIESKSPTLPKPCPKTSSTSLPRA